MRWTKVVLLFQAVVTLIIGIVFFSQLTIIGTSDLNDLREEVLSEDSFDTSSPPTLDQLRKRYTIAAYLLFVVSLAEIMIIYRLFK